MRTVEATIDAEGRVELKEPVQLPSGRRALVTILDEESEEKGAKTDLPRNGRELVEYWRREGLIGTRPDIQDSVEHARKIRREAERRRR